MSFANLLGHLLQQGVASQGPSRLEKALGGLNNASSAPSRQGGAASDPLSSLLGGLLGGGNHPTAGSTGSASAASPLLDLAQAFISQKQGTGLTGGQTGGIGALAGALLGGGQGAAKGALGGSAMAVLATLALNALQSAAQKRQAAGAAPIAGFTATNPLPPEQIEAAIAPQTSHLLIRAMVSAAKADGQIDQNEMNRILGKIGQEGTTPEERQAVMDELARPLDLQGLIRSVPPNDPLIATEVYMASLLAIEVTTEAERDYLQQLAQGLRLDPSVLAEIHDSLGVPPL